MENPKIRFKGFTKDWEQRKLIDYLEVSSEKNRDNRFTKDDVLSVSGEYGIVNQIEFQGRSFAGASVSNYGVVENGDVVYTKSPLKSNPYGIIKTNKGIPGIVSTLYAVYKPKEITDSKFVQIYFELDSRMNSYMHPLVNKGAKNDMKVSAENALKGMVSFPKKDEQEMISLYFSNLDHLITLHQRKCDQTKNLKKYMLQKMFPQNGAKVPEIRFDGYTYDWEQRKLGELVKEGILEAPLDGNHGEKHPTSDEYVDSGIPFLMASDIHNGEVNIYSCKYITKERAERLDKGFARNGDVLLTHKATIGETAILSNLMTEYAMLTPQVTYYRIKNEERLNREYLYSFFNSLDFQTELKTKAAQSTRPYIGITAQQNLKIILPAEIDEQIRIGLYFRNLDHLITLHQRKCDELKKMKKYMLQNMFI